MNYKLSGYQKYIDKLCIGKISFLSSFIFLLTVLAACSGLLETDKLNGDFEYVEDNDLTPAGWSSNILVKGKDYATISIDEKAYRSGGKSLLFEIPKSVSKQSYINKVVRSGYSLKNLNTYELSGWIKTKDINNSPYIELEFWNNGKLAGRYSTKRDQIVGTTNWKKVSSIFKIPKGTSKVIILLAVPNFQNGGGKVWFDDIKIKSLESA